MLRQLFAKLEAERGGQAAQLESECETELEDISSEPTQQQKKFTDFNKNFN